MKLHDYEMLPELAFTPRGGRFGRGMTLWGKGGGASAPPPMDPAINAALASNIQKGSDLATSGLNTYDTTTAPAIQKAINDQTQANNTYSTAANTAANQQLGIYNNTAVPALNAITADANNYNNAGYQEQIASQALGDVNQQFAQQQANNALKQQSYGINPNSGAAQMSGNANAVQQAEAGAAASTQARAAAVALGLQKQQNVFNLANPSLANANTLGTGAINATQNNVANNVTMGNANNAALSTAGGLLSGSSGAANSAYANQVSAYNAAQQANATSSAGFGNLVGTIASAGSGSLIQQGLSWLSDIRTKQNIELIEVRPDGLGMYKFEYKPRFKKHSMAGKGFFVGLLAQEVEAVYPDAIINLDSGYKAIDYSKVVNYGV